jgi:hypothetical protein
LRRVSGTGHSLARSAGARFFAVETNMSEAVGCIVSPWVNEIDANAPLMLKL